MVSVPVVVLIFSVTVTAESPSSIVALNVLLNGAPLLQLLSVVPIAVPVEDPGGIDGQRRKCES